jgi:hypothetical protein
MRRMTSVNSVTLQPKFTPISALARTGAFALPRAFAPASAFVPIVALEPFQTMAVKELLDNLRIIEQTTHIE